MLNVGDKVPDFELPLAFADGKRDKVKFSSLLGRGPVLVNFYPLAFSGVCTPQMCAVRDQMPQISGHHATTVGFSVDTPHANVAFAKSERFPFGLFSDANHEVVDKLWSTMTVGGVANRAKRGWAVVSPYGRVSEKWVTDDPTVLPQPNVIEAALAKLHTHKH